MNKEYTYTFDDSFVYENTKDALENFISYDALKSFDLSKIETYKYEKEKIEQINRIYQYVIINHPELLL